MYELYIIKARTAQSRSVGKNVATRFYEVKPAGGGQEWVE